MWVCSVSYYKMENEEAEHSDILTVKYPIGYDEDVLKLIERITNHTFTSKYENEWSKTWMLLSDSEKEKRIHLNSAVFSIPLNTTGAGGVTMEFSKVPNLE